MILTFWLAVWDENNGFETFWLRCFSGQQNDVVKELWNVMYEGIMVSCLRGGMVRLDAMHNCRAFQPKDEHRFTHQKFHSLATILVSMCKLFLTIPFQYP